jgi:deoxycytidylate deaminase
MEHQRVCGIVKKLVVCERSVVLNQANDTSYGAMMFCTTQPCSICTKILINAGIKEIVYIEPYEDELAAQLIDEAGLKMRQVEIPRKYGRNSSK